ncbi:MAG: hypothetical protein ABL879_17490 [Devosia sp.]
MTRITAALLIVAAVLAFNGGWTGQALADDQGIRIRVDAKADTCPAPEPRASRVMSLMLCLEALRQVPAPTAMQPKA